MSLLTPEALTLLPLLLLLWLGGSPRGYRLPGFSPEMARLLILRLPGGMQDRLWLTLALALMLLALARPVVFKDNHSRMQAQVHLSLAIDLSRSMQCEDVYPSRFAFAKNKLKAAIQMLTTQKASLFAFSNQAYLISPQTANHEVLEYLTEHIDPSMANQKGSNLQKLFEALQAIYGEEERKVLIVLTDGGDEEEFGGEIAFARKHGISVFVYAIATPRGGVIKEGEGLLKNSRGDIVLTTLNPAIRELAESTGGAYLEHSLNQEDIHSLIIRATEALEDSARAEDSQNRIELFFVPLLLAFGCLLLSRIGLGRVR